MEENEDKKAVEEAGKGSSPDGLMEAEVSAARAAIEEARGMLEDIVEKVGEVLEETVGTAEAEMPP
jgi:hypothetical protein